jgi:hypothetical protein
MGRSMVMTLTGMPKKRQRLTVSSRRRLFHVSMNVMAEAFPPLG